MVRRLGPGLAAFLLLTSALPLQGQSLRDKVKDLFRFGSGCAPDVLLCLYPNLATGVHGEHFNTALATGEASLVGFLTNAIGVSVSNVPLTASSSGATFTFEGGVPVQTSVSAGPIFAERAQTLGRGRAYLGGNVTGLAFQSLRGVPLDAIVFDFTHVDAAPPGLGTLAFENDIFEVRPQLSVNVVISTVLFTYGLLDRLDVGVAIPLVRTSMSGTSLAAILPFGAGSPHFFGDSAGDSLPSKQLQDTSLVEGSATGIGDIAARLKINLGASGKTGFALLADARFPTGNEEDFLGSGELAVRGLGIVSARLGNFSPHLNAGYLYRGGDQTNDALLATAGFDHLLAPWATLAMDVITEWQLGESKLTLPADVTIVTPSTRTIDVTNIPDQHDHVVTGALGVRFTRASGLTIVLNSLIPLYRGGMQADFVWTAGLEYNF